MISAGWVRWSLVGVVAGLMACGGPPAKGPSEAKEKETPRAGATPKPSATATDDGTTKLAAPSKMPSAEPMGKGSKPATPTDETTNVSPGQCDDLERVLGKLIFSDLTAKSDPKMDPARREKSEKDASELAKKTAAQFGDNCRSNMAGKEMKRDMLNCMFKAKDFSTFEGCTR